VTFLYKFQSINNNSLSALIKHSLYFASPNKLNDPTEGLSDLTGFDVNVDYPIIYNSCSILSMGIDSDNTKPLLSKSLFHWTHYGDGLKGICLVFKKDGLINNFINHIETHENVSYGYPISIDASYVHSLLKVYEGCEVVPGVCFKDQSVKNFISYAFNNKPKCFSIESEYRFVKTREGLLEYDLSSLESIIIGDKVEDDDWEILKTVLRPMSSKVTFQKAMVEKGKFLIKVKDTNLDDFR